MSCGASLSADSAAHVLSDCDRESASNAAIAPASLTGSIASSCFSRTHRYYPSLSLSCFLRFNFYILWRFANLFCLIFLDSFFISLKYGAKKFHLKENLKSGYGLKSAQKFYKCLKMALFFIEIIIIIIIIHVSNILQLYT